MASIQPYAFDEVKTQMDELTEYRQDQIAPESWTIIIVGWSVTVITFVAFFIAVSLPG